MARGWESKDVEAQVEASETRHSNGGHEAKSSEQQVREQSVKDLQLSRIRIVNDLNSATNPHHRNRLEAALAHLDKKISELS
jgi:hypothetical protein